MRKPVYHSDGHFTVEYEGQRVVLKNKDSAIVKLKEEKDSKMSFKIEGEKYTIRNRGFWNPRTEIRKRNKRVLVLSRPLLNGISLAELNSGEEYKCRVDNGLVAKLTFLTSGDVEILSYALESKKSPRVILNLHAPILSKKDLRLLIVLGCFCFTGVIRENIQASATRAKSRRKRKVNEWEASAIALD